MQPPTKLNIRQHVFFPAPPKPKKKKRAKKRIRRTSRALKKKRRQAPTTPAKIKNKNFGHPSLKRRGEAGPLNIFLLGDPAAGKATQAQFLVKKYRLSDLDMGKELRKLQASNPRVRKLLTKTYDKGHVTQTNLVRGIFKKKILATPKTKGILFDGNPKQIGEAKLIFQWLKQQNRQRAILIYLSIPMGETLKRMRNRVEYFKGKYSKRTDDNQAALQNRVKYYRKNIAGVVKFFRTKYPYKQISGLGSREQVKKRMMEFVKKYEKRVN